MPAQEKACKLLTTALPCLSPAIPTPFNLLSLQMVQTMTITTTCVTSSQSKTITSFWRQERLMKYMNHTAIQPLNMI